MCVVLCVLLLLYVRVVLCVCVVVPRLAFVVCVWVVCVGCVEFVCVLCVVAYCLSCVFNVWFDLFCFVSLLCYDVFVYGCGYFCCVVWCVECVC